MFEYTYNGEPVTLDFVNACGGSLTIYKDNDRSEDIFTGPQLYGVKLSDGKALVAKGAYCGYSDRKDSGWPPDLMPLVIVYDNSETLESGYAYVSNEAYERPNSPLKLVKARITPVSPGEAADLLKNQKPNVVRSWNIQSPWSVRDFKKLNPGKRPAIGVNCEGFMKLPVPSDVVGELRKHWPESLPRYWVPREEGDDRGEGKQYQALAERFRFSHLYGGPTIRDGIEVPGRDITDYLRQGVPTRTDGGSSGANWDHGKGFENNPRRRNLYIAPPFYPLIRIDEKFGARVNFENLGDFHFKVETEGDAKRGLLYCAGPGLSYYPRQPNDSSACDIHFGENSEALSLPAPFVGDPRSHYCTAIFDHRWYIYENDQFVWRNVTETIASDLGEQQDEH